jgi:hypothetical protein
MFSLSSPISISTKIKETIEKSNRKYAEQKMKEHEKKQYIKQVIIPNKFSLLNKNE